MALGEPDARKRARLGSVGLVFLSNQDPASYPTLAVSITPLGEPFSSCAATGEHIALGQCMGLFGYAYL